MSTANLDSADLKAALAAPGLIREEVMDQLFDISRIPLPFTDSISSDTTSNSYTEWVVDSLEDPDPTAADAALIDGQDLSQNDTAVGVRVGNRCQISGREVQVSTRADNSDSIANQGKLSFQVMRRQQDLRRQREAILLSNQASVADNGNNTPGKLGGFPAWLETNFFGGLTSAAGGFDTSTKNVDAFTEGTARGLTETLVRDAAQAVYEQGGNPSIFMSSPGVIRGLSSWMFDSSARIATLQRQTSAGSPGYAVGAVNVFLTDFGVTLEMTSNRLQPLQGAADDVYCAFVYDPEYVRQSFLRGYRVEPLAKTGLSEKRMMTVDGTLKVLNEKAHAVIADIDQTIAVTA